MASILSRGKILLVVAALAIIIFLIAIAVMYNGLVAREQGVFAQWAQVENQYQRKIDLIPQLIGLLQDFSEFERSTLENITRLRSQWINSTTIDQQVNTTNALDQNLIAVRVTYESYPDLHFPETVRDVMFSVEGTENRIAVERGRYNEAVRSYNTAIYSFPGNLVAGMFGFQPHAYYDPISGGPA